MLDPLTAFATAGTVLQVVDFGGKILRVAIDYAQHGGTTEVSSIESYVRTLVAANLELQDTLLRDNEAIAPGPGRALHLANSRCLAISRELVQVIQSLKLDKMSWWRVDRSLESHIDALQTKISLSPNELTQCVARSAFHEHRAKPKLKEIEQELKSAKDNLTVCFLIYLNQKQDQTVLASETMSETMRDIRDTLSRSHSLEQHINNIDTAMRSLSLSEEAYQIDLKAILKSNRDDLRYISDRLDTRAFTQTEQIYKLENRLARLEWSIQTELRTRVAVVSSLSFPNMGDRKASIQNAHRETFQWIFEPGVQKRHAWDNFTDWIKSTSSSSMYWIRGKPGSGKSTLLKVMTAEIGHRSLEGDWSRQQEAIVASAFFWNGGTSKQRSLQGLLQSLLHQILEARPEIVPQSVSPRRWQHHQHSSTTQLDWSNEELKKSLHASISSLDGAPLILLIDGLDEFEGDDDERLGMIDLLRSLNSAGRVKICLSSRPWNIFKDAFVDCPQLRLEDLTFDDIHKFVHDSLMENDLFMRKLSRQLSLLEELTASIVCMAEGVFLWVRLVVRDLLKALRDGYQISGLKRILDDTPRDLNEYFMRMMQQMDSSYRGDAARILRLKIQDLSFSSTLFDMHEPPSLRLFDLYHLQHDPKSIHFVLGSECEIIDFESCEKDIVEELFDTLERRVASRSMGLLEVFAHSRDKSGLLRAEIVYLHRTVKDFLTSPQAQTTIQFFLDQSFDALGFWCNILVARLLGLGLNGHLTLASTVIEYESWTDYFLGWAQAPAMEHDKMLALYEAAAPSIACSGLANDDYLQRPLKDLWIKSDIERDDFVPVLLAIQAGWSAYIESIPSSRLPRWWRGQSLLQIALQPQASECSSPSPQVVQAVLALDIDPNQRYKTDRIQRVGTADSEYRESSSSRSIWADFIGSLLIKPIMDRESVVSTIEVMLRAGASPLLGISDVEAYFIEWMPARSHLLPFPNIVAVHASDKVHIVGLLDCNRSLMRKTSEDESLTDEDLDRLRRVCLEVESQYTLASASEDSEQQESTMSCSRAHLRPTEQRKRCGTTLEDPALAVKRRMTMSALLSS